MDNGIPATFITHAAAILGETNRGLSGTQIIESTSAWAVDCGVALPHHAMGMANKRTVLRENLMAFRGSDRYRVLKDLCDRPQFKDNADVQQLRIKLITTYGAVFDTSSASDIDDPLIVATTHWLGPFPEALTAFNSALVKHRANVLARNLLDDLRLSLEVLVKSILKNGKSLENQKAELGKFLKERESSPELREMFITLLSYYCHYQNSYVKHNDDVNSEEIEIMFEMTSCFLKHLVRLNAKNPQPQPPWGAI